jgi:hypothetical protein
VSPDNRLQPGEVEIDASQVSYFPPGGDKCRGNLTVTNRRLLYQGTCDASLKHAKGPKTFVKWDGEGGLQIDRRDIRRVEINDRGLTRLCVLILKDGSRHAFDYGEKTIDKVAAELQRTRPAGKDGKPASLGRRLLKIAICAVALVIVSDIAGAVVCTVMDLVFPWSTTRALFYAIWIVFGLFTGMFIHYFAGAVASPDSEGVWTDREDAARTGMLVCAVTALVLAGLALGSRRLRGSSDSMYVPDDPALSTAYFIAIAAGVAFSQLIIPKATKRKS